MKAGHTFLCVVIASLLAGPLQSQVQHEVRLDAVDKLVLHNVKVEPVIYRGSSALRVSYAGGESATDNESLAIVPGASLQDGTIEVTLAGDTAADAPPLWRGFVGIAFRVTDASHFECMYIRPKNGRSEDQLQRNHSAKYISVPGYPWEKLRNETPGKFESYVDLVPGEWTKIKIMVQGQSAKLYVNGAAQPTLIVNDLKQPVAKGGIALWVGPGTIAHFRDLKIAP